MILLFTKHGDLFVFSPLRAAAVGFQPSGYEAVLNSRVQVCFLLRPGVLYNTAV